MQRRLIELFAFLIFLVVSVPLALAQETVEEFELDGLEQDVVISADVLSYDEPTKIVTATGNVEITQGERVLLADRVTYDQNTGKVSAAGEVTLLEPTGEVIFADEVELTDDLREGFVRAVGMLFTDGSRMVANGANRYGGRRTELRKVIFSPCQLCIENPTRAPLWQIKANRVVHDQEARDITYYGAWLEVFGLPVIYTPYFKHPDPTVKRRSGFLSPSYGTSTALGFEVTVPYFWNIAPHRDVTISPRLTDKEGLILGAQYRERTHDGRFEFDGSGTYTDARDDNGTLTGGYEFRGHIFGYGTFDIDELSRWSFQLERASDDTYLNRYGISGDDVLITRGTVESFNDRSYAAANAYWFQGLENGDEDDQIPIAFPRLDLSYVSDPILLGGHLTLDGNLLVLERLTGVDSRRVSVNGGWYRPFVTDGGQLFQVWGSLRADAYLVNNLVDPTDISGATKQDLTGRIVPEVGIEWRYPWIAEVGTIRQIIEPIVQVIASPNGGNPDEIPNEDSQDFEFDQSNLFSNNRFTGLDRVEGGPRANYGLHLGVYGESGGRATVLLGQSARLRADATFDLGSGLEDHFSDYVGQISVTPSPLFAGSYRFRLDRNDLSARRNEIDLAGGPSWLRLAVSYALIDQQIASGGTTTFENREEIVASGITRFLDHWALSAGARRDLGSGATIDWNLGLDYEDECLFFGTRVIRSFTRDREVEPDTSIIFTINLKHLG